MKCCCFSRWKMSIRRKHSLLRTICARPWRRPVSARSRTFIFSNSGFKPFNNCQNWPAFDLARFNRLPTVLQPLTRRCDSKKEKGSELTIDTKWTILSRHFCHQSLNFIHIRSTETELYLKDNIMPTYISLVQFTDKGIQAAKETTQRVADWAAKVQSKGVSIKQMYWTLGEYDQVCVFEAPNDETAASVLLAADILGNIRTQTLRAFTADEMEKILAKVP